MAYEGVAQPALDYAPCRYGTSKLLFRGPRAALGGDYIAFLGSTETYGKFVENPYPKLTGSALDLTPLNLGCVNAGIDTFLDDPTVLELCRGARAVVVQAMGAHKLSNQLYSVHPRRNDRFLSASALLGRMFPEAEFTEIHFTRHLLSMLHGIDAARFAAVVEELQATWVARMRTLAQAVGVPLVLLWVSDRRPEALPTDPGSGEPLFVTRRMIDDLRYGIAGLVEVAAPAAGRAPPDGMVFTEVDLPAVRELPGPAVHATIAQRLAPALRFAV